jgi:CBS domain-containing protein
MSKVKEVLDKKGRQYFFVKRENTVYEALQAMADKDVGAVMVVDNDKLIGMFTERDYARKIVLHGLASRSSRVGDFMTKEVFSVHSDTSIYDCMAIMTSKRIRHLPVIDDDKIIGLISIGDVVNSVIQQQDVTIKDLENYIYGGRSVPS